jgi:dTDP-4-dehydrorhamnose 3,5-epimerase
MHFQHPPFQESKLIRCIAGSVLDVIVDLRQGSPTFLKSERLLLSQKNMHSVLVPPGFAHGFQTLEDNTELLYLHSAFYEPSSEGGLHYKDPLLAIDWPLAVSSISVRDQQHSFISENFEGIKL